MENSYWRYNSAHEEYTLCLNSKCEAYARNLASPKTKSVGICKIGESRARSIYSVGYSLDVQRLDEAGNYASFVEHLGAIEKAEGLGEKAKSGLRIILDAIQEKHICLEE